MQMVMSASCLASLSSLFFLPTSALWSTMITPSQFLSSLFLSYTNKAPALSQLLVLPEFSNHLIGERCAHMHTHTHTHTHTHPVLTLSP